MAAETNTTMKADLISKSIDFDNQFKKGIKSLLDAIGVTRMHPMASGSQIKIYETSVDKKDGNVAEGETIPLSKVTKKLKETKELTFKKYRKQTTFEAIQSAGFSDAVNDTDDELVRSIQSDIKKDLYGAILEGTGKATGDNFQLALANSLGQLSVLWEDYDTTSVAFVNPIDFYAYLGGNQISVQTAFGLTYVQNYLGFDIIILTSAVTAGKIATTVANNMNFFYADIRGGEAARHFNLTADETGLIGVNHEPINDSLNYQTVAVTSGLLIPERLDGIVIATIGKAGN